MGDAILRIPRDARVRAYRTRDTYDGVVPATSKRQPYCPSSYIELSGKDAIIHIPRVICADARISRAPDERGIRKMASPSKHVLLLTEDRRQIV